MNGCILIDLMPFPVFLKMREALIISRGLIDTPCVPAALLVIFCEPLKKHISNIKVFSYLVDKFRFGPCGVIIIKGNAFHNTGIIKNADG